MIHTSSSTLSFSLLLNPPRNTKTTATTEDSASLQHPRTPPTQNVTHVQVATGARLWWVVLNNNNPKAFLGVLL